MATWAQTVNVLAPLMTNEKSVVCQTIYYPMALYRQLCGSRAVLTEVDVGNLQVSEKVSTLDVASSVDDSGKLLTIAVVNRSATERVDMQIDVVGRRPRGQWSVHELNAPSIEAVNTPRNPEKNVVRHLTKFLPANTRRYSLPAHGIAVLQVGLVG